MSVFSRRQLLTSSVALAAGITIAGCVSDDEHTYENSGGDGTPPPDPPPFPRTVQHQFGSTTAKAQPQRIVALGRGDADVLLALGVVPTAILGSIKSPWAPRHLAGATPELLSGPGIDFARIAAIAPDLVTYTRSDNDRATWERLNNIAPTIAGQPTASARGFAPFDTAWQDQAGMIGAIAGHRMADVRKLIADTTTAVAAAKDGNPSFTGKTVCVATVVGGQFHACLHQHDRLRFMEALGFTNSVKIEGVEANMSSPPRHVTTFPLADAWRLDADLTVVFGVAQMHRAAILNTPSAKAGRLLFIDDNLANVLGANSVLSIPYALDKFVPLARKALV